MLYVVCVLVGLVVGTFITESVLKSKCMRMYRRPI